MFLLIIWMSILTVVHPAMGLNTENRFELADILPEDQLSYDKLVPPVTDRNSDDPLVYDPAVVELYVNVDSIDSINEVSMTYTANVFFAQKWKDSRLRFPNNMTYEYRILDVKWLDEIWRPDTYFKNAKSVQFSTVTVPNHYIWLYRDKTIFYMMKLSLTLSCAMDFATYPHDTQQCKMQIESLSHTMDELVFKWDKERPIIFNGNLQLPQLALVDGRHGDCSTVYKSGNFTCVEAVFVFKRDMGYYLIHTYIPSCLIVIISWISFWIKPEAIPARISLGVTTLLTLSTQHGKSQASLPPVSYLKTVDAFMSASTIFVFMSLMEMCLVNIILGDFGSSNKKETEKPKMSPDSTAEANNGNGNDHKRSPSISTLSSPDTSSTSDINSKDKRLEQALLVDRISRVLFPVLFLLLNCVYWLWALFHEYLFTQK